LPRNNIPARQSLTSIVGNDLLFGLADWTTISYLGLLIAIGSAILAKKDLILSHDRDLSCKPNCRL
jgi:hypothetical protein